MTGDAAILYMYLMVVSVFGQLALLSLQLIAYTRSRHKSLLLLAAGSFIAFIQAIVGLPGVHFPSLTPILFDHIAACRHRGFLDPTVSAGPFRCCVAA